MSDSARKKPSIHAGHRKRMKEQYRQLGHESLNDYQLLELLLFYAIPQGDVSDTAYQLLSTFHSLAGVLDAPLEQLLAVPGVGEHTALLLHLSRDMMQRYSLSLSSRDEVLDSTGKVAEFLQPYFYGLNHEAVYLLCMDQRRRVLRLAQMGEGSLFAVSSSPREFIRAALGCKAYSAVLAHNHPSGRALPSEADLTVTRSIYQALRQVGVTLEDHLIFADDDYITLRHSMGLAKYIWD